MPEARRLELLADYLVDEKRLAGRRRRLGLRHRLRRTRSRPVHAPQGQHPGARHGGLLEHGRPGVQEHAAGRGRQVRRGRQGRPQEGPRPDGHELRPRLRRLGRLRGQGQPHGAGLPGGRELRRAVADHRLQPLHRPRLRSAFRRRAAEAGRQLRRLAAVSLRSAPRSPGRAAADHRRAAGQEAGRGVHA